MIIDYDKDNVWHVYPVGDLKEHQLVGYECKCNPKIEVQSNKGLVVIHNSYDNREYMFEGKGVS
jgi:hypothetical protein